MGLGFHDESSDLEFLFMQGLAIYFSEYLRVQMGQVAMLMGLDVVDTNVTLSWIESWPDCAPKGRQRCLEGVLPHS